MGMEIDKISNGQTPKELLEIQRLNAEKLKTKEVKEDKKAEQKKGNNEVKLDTYNKHAVSDSIEKQIAEQKAKIEEMSKNLEGLREEYAQTAKAEKEARTERYLKERERYQKEVQKRSLFRIFADWRERYLRRKEDEAIKRFYGTSYFKYETALDDHKMAEKAYDLADIAAYEAIHAHNIADAHYLSGLWVQQDAYWDLARMHRRLMVAKIREGYLK